MDNKETTEKPVKYYKISYPDKSFTGLSCGIWFKKGEARISASNTAAIDLFKKMNYKVEAL